MSVAPALGPLADHWVDSGPEPDQPTGPIQTACHVLVLEDDSMCSNLLCEILRSEGLTPWVYATVASAREAIGQREFDFFILDHRLPDGTGAAFYYLLLDRVEFAPAIMLTAVPEISKAVELTKTGLLDYLTKPFSLVQLRSCLTQGLARRQSRASKNNQALSSVAPVMRQVYRQARLAGANPLSTVLLTGETGVGKDILARAIHDLSQKNPAAPRPFVSLNCATLPQEMFESELFGAERGAYTGAHQPRAGLVEAADGGTLFLDEIGEVPLHSQAKLLHLLESREYRRLGGAVPRKFSGRIIAATNKSLQTAAEQGTFRPDLLYRLDVFSIYLPPLRERKEDIMALSCAILSELGEKYSRRVPQLRNEDLDLFNTYSFPGNIRELRNILERSLLEAAPESAWLQLSSEARKKLHGRNLSMESVPEKASDLPPNLTPLESQEYRLIRQALQSENGTIRRAAARLSISHQALLRRLEKWPDLRNFTQARH